MWQLAPKHFFTGKRNFGLATYCALSNFNEGLTFIIKIIQAADISLGPVAYSFAKAYGNTRINEAERSIATCSAEAAWARRRERAFHWEYDVEEEDNLYGADVGDIM